jgi:hypothetical protein
VVVDAGIVEVPEVEAFAGFLFAHTLPDGLPGTNLTKFFIFLLS